MFTNIKEAWKVLFESKNSKGKPIKTFLIYYDVEKNLWKLCFDGFIIGEEFYENKSLENVLKLAFKGGATEIKFIEW